MNLTREAEEYGVAGTPLVTPYQFVYKGCLPFLSKNVELIW